MPYTAQILPVMIASPGDVAEERAIATDVIGLWNAVNSIATGTFLSPVRWETHAGAELSGRPQGIINERLLDHCDLLVGIFWTRLGTPTGEAESGTVEEIQRHVAAGKPAMVYFSIRPAAPDFIDHDQYQRVKEFKAWCRERGLTWDYENNEDFRQKFSHQLGLIIHNHAYFKTLKQAAVVSAAAAAASEAASSQEEKIIRRLSKEAQELLLAASDKDASGRILNVASIGRKIIQAGSHQFGGGSNHREIALWEYALSQLEDNDLVSTNDGKRQVFRVTHLGFEVADRLQGVAE